MLEAEIVIRRRELEIKFTVLLNSTIVIKTVADNLLRKAKRVRLDLPAKTTAIKKITRIFNTSKKLAKRLEQTIKDKDTAIEEDNYSLIVTTLATWREQLEKAELEVRFLNS